MTQSLPLLTGTLTDSVRRTPTKIPSEIILGKIDPISGLFFGSTYSEVMYSSIPLDYKQITVRSKVRLVKGVLDADSELMTKHTIVVLNIYY